MKIELQKMIDNYYIWLRDQTTFEDVGNGWSEITTPYLDRHNDAIQIYFKNEEKENFILNDGGETINDLLSSGLSLETLKNKDYLKIVLNGFGIKLGKNNELTTAATIKDFPYKKHCLLQAIISINDLYYLASPHSTNLFLENVGNWLKNSNIRYTPDVLLSGKTGFSRRFDYVIPRSTNSPERIIRAINYPNKTSTSMFIMDWLDTKDMRTDKSVAYVIANDEDKNISNEATEALKVYDINTILWSQKEASKELLAA
ncbi:MAG: DUF1829 domain-containing protein [Deltaproteobacteria bacterium]|jgi:hypothetical protein|nr:DUF1829 domain-containing protein [Deltaproteobacteria bacterium]